MTLAFTDFIFFIVLAVSLPVYWLLGKKPRAQNLTLLIICYFVYGFVDYWFLYLIVISTAFNYLFGILQGKIKNKKKKKLVLSICVIVNICYLFVFKYFNFFTTEISAVLSLFGLRVNPLILQIFLPIGISFYTLQVIAYNIDVYRGDLPVCKNILRFAIFVGYFPKLTAGPIEHPKNFMPQLEKGKEFKDYYNNGKFRGAFQLLLLGYFKKIVVADVIANQIASFYQNPEAFSYLDAKLIVILYTIQIYMDFSAYSDLARGISRLYGFELMINFNQPYLSTNPQEFWRRWHISLSEWFRDYVYKPLGGNRKGFMRLCINLLIIFVLSGIWHGVGLNFILWGFFHGVWIVIFRLNNNLISKWKMKTKTNVQTNQSTQKSKFMSKVYKFLGWFLTFQIVNLLWIFFRTPDIQIAFIIIYRVYFTPLLLSIDVLNDKFFRLLLFSAVILFLIDLIQRKLNTHEIFGQIHWSLRGVLYAICIIMILMFYNINIVYAPFIYEGF